MTTPDTIDIDGQPYQRIPTPNETPIRIVILQHGWVMVGRCHDCGDEWDEIDYPAGGDVAEITVCPECESLNVSEIYREAPKHE